MGTRSFVGVMVGDVCRTVYVHWEGYLSGVGKDLQAYTTQVEVEKLISHGDRSSLEDGFYKDRGETGVMPIDYATFYHLYDAANRAGAEFYYVFKDGVWYCGDTYGNTPLSKKLVPFSEAVLISKE